MRTILLTLCLMLGLAAAPVAAETFCFEMPDADATDFIDKIASARGYQATVPDPNDPLNTIPNPQTKKQFVEAKLIEAVRSNYGLVALTETLKTTGDEDQARDAAAAVQSVAITACP